MIVLPRTRDRELVDCHHGGLSREIFKVVRLAGRLASCCAGRFWWPGAFWRRRLACVQPNEDRSVALRPVLASPRPLATLIISTRTGTGFLAAFRVVNGLSDARQHRAGRSVSPPRGARGW